MDNPVREAGLVQFSKQFDNAKFSDLCFLGLGYSVLQKSDNDAVTV